MLGEKKPVNHSLNGSWFTSFSRVLQTSRVVYSANSASQPIDLQQTGLLSAHARKSKNFLVFALLLEHVVFGAAEFDNRTFEGESFFNRSSVSHVRHVTVKSNSKWKETVRFISLMAIVESINRFSCTRHRQRWRFPCNKDEAKQALIHVYSALKITTGLIGRQPKGTWLLW